MVKRFPDHHDLSQSQTLKPEVVIHSSGLLQHIIKERVPNYKTLDHQAKGMSKIKHICELNPTKVWTSSWCHSAIVTHGLDLHKMTRGHPPLGLSLKSWQNPWSSVASVSQEYKLKISCKIVFFTSLCLGSTLGGGHWEGGGRGNWAATITKLQDIGGH